MKISQLCTSMLFIIFITGIFIINCLKTDSEFSELENRYLSQLPELSIKSFFSGDWSEDIEIYINDQFFMRDSFVTLKSSAEQLLGKSENNQVYLSTEDTLIEKFITPNYKQIDTNLSAIQSFSKLSVMRSTSVQLALIPTASDIYQYKLPKNAPNVSQLDILNDIDSQIDYLISPYETLINHKDEYLYYNTDHHWTSLGAYYASNDILESLGKEPLTLGHYNPTLQCDNFYGTLYAKSGIRGIDADTITTYVPNQELQLLENNQWMTGNLYDLDNLVVSDKYTMFQGGNYPYIKITGTGVGSLLLVKDSFANSLVPFFIEHYETIHMVDMRFNRNSMSELVVTEGIDNVLFCYSLANFSNDTNLAWLR